MPQGVDSFSRLPVSGPAAGETLRSWLGGRGDVFYFSLAGCCGEGCDLWLEFRGAASNPCGFSEGLRSSLLDGGSQQPQCVSQLPPSSASAIFQQDLVVGL